MSATLQPLGAVTNTPLDKMAYGPLDWTAIHTATHAALSAGPAALANNQHFCTAIDVSVSADQAAATTITIKDGTTVIWQIELAINGRNIARVFEPALRATVGAALTLNMGDAGSGVVQTACMAGYTTPSNSPVTV